MPEGTEGREASRLTFSMSGPAFPEALVTKAPGPLLTGTKVSQQQESRKPQAMTSAYFLVWGWDPECPTAGVQTLLERGSPSTHPASTCVLKTQPRKGTSGHGAQQRDPKTRATKYGLHDRPTQEADTNHWWHRWRCRAQGLFIL